MQLGLYYGFNTANVSIDTSGHVGIGTTNPARSLEIQMTTSGPGLLLSTVTSGSEAAILSVRGSSGAESQKGYFRLSSEGTSTVVLDTNGSSYLNGGNVGIGTTNPDEFVHIQNDQNSDTQLLVENNTAGTGASARIQLKTNSGGGHLSAYDDGYSNADFADRIVLYANTGNGIKINTRGNGDLEFAIQGDTTEHIMTTAGRVGFGTNDATNYPVQIHAASEILGGSSGSL